MKGITGIPFNFDQTSSTLQQSTGEEEYDESLISMVEYPLSHSRRRNALGERRYGSDGVGEVSREPGVGCGAEWGLG